MAFPVDPMLCVVLFSFLLAGFMAWSSHRTSLAPDPVIAFPSPAAWPSA